MQVKILKVYIPIEIRLETSVIVQKELELRQKKTAIM
jgi:hypothetical protein